MAFVALFVPTHETKIPVARPGRMWTELTVFEVPLAGIFAGKFVMILDCNQGLSWAKAWVVSNARARQKIFLIHAPTMRATVAQAQNTR